MKILPLVLLAGLVPPALGPWQERKAARQGEQQEGEKRPTNPITAFFEGEGARLTTEVEGSWILFDYLDPLEAPLDDTASGFATFHDGFLTLILAIDTIESRLFRANSKTLLSSGAYRYRFDEQAFLQLSNVISFTNETDDGDLQREPAGKAYEYYVQLTDGVLELRNAEGIRFTFRKITAGEFPDSAIRKLEGRRGGTEHWEEEGAGR